MVCVCFCVSVTCTVCGNNSVWSMTRGNSVWTGCSRFSKEYQPTERRSRKRSASARGSVNIWVSIYSIFYIFLSDGCWSSVFEIFLFSLFLPFFFSSKITFCHHAKEQQQLPHSCSLFTPPQLLVSIDSTRLIRIEHVHSLIDRFFSQRWQLRVRVQVQ